MISFCSFTFCLISFVVFLIFKLFYFVNLVFVFILLSFCSFSLLDFPHSFFNRDLNRGCLVYIISLRFLIFDKLTRQFRVRKNFGT